MPKVDISVEGLQEIRMLIDDLHDFFDKYADVDADQPNVEMVLLSRLELLDYIFNENVKKEVT